MNQAAFWKSCEETQFSSKYYLHELLGVGGFGAVFRADEVVADRRVRTVALKVFNPFSTPNLDALIQEFQMTVELNHPHLIKTYVPEEGKLQSVIDAVGLVMELAGEDLAKRLERGPLSEIEAQVLVQHVGAALAFLHSKGIVHRDIKPHNIMAVGSGPNLVWKVGDLGIMRFLADKTATMTTNRQGAPFYVPPEAYSGEVSAAMDVWALGVTIVQALTGQLPFPGPSEAQVVQQVLNQEPVLPDLGNFKSIVQGCLTKDRTSRWRVSRVLEAVNTLQPAPMPSRGRRPPKVNDKDRLQSIWDIDAVRLQSEKGINYQWLRDLLKAGQWQEADRLTEKTIEAILRTGDWYTIYDANLLQKIPCKDLRTLDLLWTHASQGYYGFSVQKRIYLQCGAKLDGHYPGDTIWNEFCTEVGWRKAQSWVTYDKIQWSSRTIKGHLPLWRAAGSGLEWTWRGVVLFPRLHKCKL